MRLSFKPMGASAPTAPGKSAPMELCNDNGKCCELTKIRIHTTLLLMGGVVAQVWHYHSIIVILEVN